MTARDRRAILAARIRRARRQRALRIAQIRCVGGARP